MTPQRRAIDAVQPATVMVRTDWTANVDLGDNTVTTRKWSGACTGEIVSSDGYVVTAGHCLDSGMGGAKLKAVQDVVDQAVRDGVVSASRRDRIVASAMSGRDRWVVFGKDRDSPPSVSVQVQLGGGVASLPDVKNPKDGISARAIEVLPFDQGDVSLLKVEEDDLPVALLAPRDEAQVGQEMVSIGYPFEDADGDQVALTNQNGQINSVDTTGVHGPGNLFYRTSATLSKGMSGGPAVALDGRVLGIASNTSASNKGNFIVPSSVVAEVLARHGVANTPGRIDALYRTALDDFYHGYYTKAINGFNEVVAIMPEHALAKQRSREAANLRQQFGDPVEPPAPARSSGHPALVWGAVAAAGVALLALVLLGIRHRRRRRSGAAATLIELPGASYPGPGLSSYPEGPYAPTFDSPVSAGAPPMSAPPGGVPTNDVSPTSEPWTSAPATLVSTPVSGSPVPHPRHAATGGFCPACGAAYPDNAAFCSACGGRLAPATSAPR
ncbi:trypsin-like peptidase domain-containing protein [Actinoplanes sp. NPDC049265]|uniref:trypsin-like peptidase domain-containing protein n=1 Tax=Actinoplanes sp. NPDC049265 TaxID=3363902 RepID=UPI003722E309